MDAIDQIFHEAKDVFRRRNEQYGTQNIRDAGIEGVLARIRDKMGRIEHTKDKDALRDASMDLANYGFILALLAADQWGHERRDLQVIGGLHEPARPGDVGFDLAISEDVHVVPDRITYAKTGVKILCPTGVWARIAGRSSLARKHGVLAIEGVIDQDYTGELLVGLYSLSGEVDLICGQRVAQVIFFETTIPKTVRVEMLPETPRGSNGFGSTGV
jgi:dUTP pyrophosphatase